MQKAIAVMREGAMQTQMQVVARRGRAQWVRARAAVPSATDTLAAAAAFFLSCAVFAFVLPIWAFDRLLRAGISKK